MLIRFARITGRGRRSRHRVRADGVAGDLRWSRRSSRCRRRCPGGCRRRCSAARRRSRSPRSTVPALAAPSTTIPAPLFPPIELPSSPASLPIRVPGASSTQIPPEPFGSAAEPSPFVPITLPRIWFADAAESCTWIPHPVFPEITLRSADVSPPRPKPRCRGRRLCRFRGRRRTSSRSRCSCPMIVTDGCCDVDPARAEACDGHVRDAARPGASE